MTARTLSRVRLALWTAVVLAAIGATLLFLLAPPQRGGGIGGGSYALLDQRGNAVNQTVLEGHPSLLFFGYTHCPDVCPTTMGEMAGWFEALGQEGADLRAYFVTIDPARDTPEILDGYVSWVSDRITALTGPQEEIDKVVKAWAAVAERVEGDNGDYTMNHTASVYLINPQGGFEGTIAYGENQETALGKIRKLLDKA
jgi:protein SCO1/2